VFFFCISLYFEIFGVGSPVFKKMYAGLLAMLMVATFANTLYYSPNVDVTQFILFILKMTFMLILKVVTFARFSYCCQFCVEAILSFMLFNKRKKKSS
jgi:hypothetical protein